MFKAILDFLLSSEVDRYPRGVAEERAVAPTPRYIDAAPVRTNREVSFTFHDVAKDLNQLKANKLVEYVYVALSTLAFVSNRNETAFDAYKYLTKTFRGDFIEKPTLNDTRLYRALHIIATKNVELLDKNAVEENEFYFKRHEINIADITTFAKTLIDGKLDHAKAAVFFKGVIDSWGITNSKMIYYAKRPFDWHLVEDYEREEYVSEVFGLIDAFENNNSEGEIREMVLKFGNLEKVDAEKFGQTYEDNHTENYTSDEADEDEEYRKGLKTIGTAAALGVGSYYVTRKILSFGRNDKD